MVEVQLPHHFHNVFKKYNTGNKKFSDFIYVQLSNHDQHHQMKIREVSHFCIILELVAYKLICF